MKPMSLQVFAAATALGIATGWVWAARQLRVHRQALFARATHRRVAALGWLTSRADPSTLGLLRDYLAWERVPMLRRRAARLITVLEARR